MTPQEQDYGVSVRLNRAVKKFRSVIINNGSYLGNFVAGTLSENETPNSEPSLNSCIVSGTWRPDFELTNDSSVESDRIILLINKIEFFVTHLSLELRRFL